jgi:3-carboxy-cis,cis-muconate cycloisomerase
MSVHVTDSVIFRDFYSTGQMRAVFDDGHLVDCWLTVEAALARAQAKLGIIPEWAAQEINRQAKSEAIDLKALGQGTSLVGYPILPLVRQLSSLCEGEAGRYVHWGATTQDIMDTANVLQLRQAMDIIGRDLDALISTLAGLAKDHRDTPMAGRTHGQHALPITFGFKVAVWVDELRRHQERFGQCRPRLLRCQFGGAAGTLASLDQDGWQVHQALAEELDLSPAPIAWFTARDTFAEFVSLCGLLTATLGKMAHEVAMLQKNEFGEVAEPFESGKGSSSTMPQKRNPILCEAVIGIAQITSQQVPTMLTAMKPEHERAMGEWHAEWDVLPHACQLTGAALAHSLEIFGDLRLFPEAMKRNLGLTDGQIVAEAIMMRLGERIGRQRAHDLVYEACERSIAENASLYTILKASPEISDVLAVEEVRRLLEPTNYVGLAPFFVDQIISNHDVFYPVADDNLH